MIDSYAKTIHDAQSCMLAVMAENTDRFAKPWDRWHAIQIGTGKIVARGKNRWDCALNARERGYEEETNLQRFQRRGNR